jgi:hypothetical protein
MRDRLSILIGHVAASLAQSRLVGFIALVVAIVAACRGSDSY